MVTGINLGGEGYEGNQPMSKGYVGAAPSNIINTAFYQDKSAQLAAASGAVEVSGGISKKGGGRFC
jgi:hypothetical protein